jgi:hypothetical protein
LRCQLIGQRGAGFIKCDGPTLNRLTAYQKKKKKKKKKMMMMIMMMNKYMKNDFTNIDISDRLQE